MAVATDRGLVGGVSTTSVGLTTSVGTYVAVDCIALNYWGKHKRKMAIWGIQLTGKQPAAIELPRRVHFTTTRLHYHYIGIRLLRKFACGDYHSDLLLMGTILWWPFIYMWGYLLAATHSTYHQRRVDLEGYGLYLQRR